MTTRRAILAGLGALPAAALSVAPAATASALASPDAGLLALAAHALVLNERHDAALDREARIDDRLCARRLPPRPSAETLAAHEAGWAAHERAFRAWKAKCEVIRRSPTLRAAERASRRADRRLVKACVALTAMRAATLQGIAAKARVSVAVNPDRHYSTAWMLDLSASVMRDVLAAAGDA